MPWLPLEILVVGTAVLAALALVPAALLTTLKGHLELFAWGFLTFGMAWFGGALLLAPPDSSWAHRFYSDEQRERARLPFERQRSRRVFFAWVAATFVLIATIGSLVLRPAPVLGLDGEALGASVPQRTVFGVLGLDTVEACERVKDGDWLCRVSEGGSGSSVLYDVRVNGRGCWTATPRDPHWEHRNGCVTLVDYVWQ